MSALAHQTGSDPVWCMPHAPRVAARARIARALFLRAVRGPPLRVVLPDGASAGGGGPDAPVMTIEREAVFHRLAAGGKSGFGEAYMAGDWRADDLSAMLGAFAARVERLLPGPFQRHYDLSNDLFALFLGPTMTYSAPVFEPGDTLEAAQIRKYDALSRIVGLGPSDHVTGALGNAQLRLARP